tara:strand:- start:699 stop:2564 length:1866 start_codon:yes stop_codon:yes gene_type:complete
MTKDNSEKGRRLSVLNYTSPTAPKFIESPNKDYIEMGLDNLYPHYLEELFASSSIHGAVVKGVSEMIYGEGLDSPDKDKHIEQWLKVKQIFGDGTCLKRSALDIKLYGQCYLNVIWSQDRSTISEVHHIPASTIRCGKADDEDIVRTFFHSTDWSDNSITPKPIPAFNVSDRSSASQLVHIKLYNPLSFYYGLPDYLASQNYIEVDASLGEFHLNSIKNGFFPSTILSFNDGVPTEEERIQLEQLIYNKFGGVSGQKILMTFNDGKESAPTIDSFPLQDQHKTFDYLTKECATKILSGHRVVSPLLFGIRSEGGGFGSNADEMRDAYELFYKTVILPFQNVLLTGLRPILASCSITIPLELKKFIPANFIEETEAVPPPPRAFSEDPKKISLEDSEAWLMHLSDKATAIPTGYQLWRTETVENTDEDKWFHSFKKMHRAFSEVDGYDNYDEPTYDTIDSSENNPLGYDVISPRGYLFAVRYSYIENAKTPPVDPNYKSRDFCEAMMDLSKGGAMYRYEDINDMSEDGVNGQFAHSGGSYSILKYKGGCFCRHAFQRNIFVYAPDGEAGEFSVEQNVEIQGDFDVVMNRVGNNPYVVNEGYETVAPIDMPDRGSIKYPKAVN